MRLLKKFGLDFFSSNEEIIRNELSSDIVEIASELKEKEESKSILRFILR